MCQMYYNYASQFLLYGCMTWAVDKIMLNLKYQLESGGFKSLLGFVFSLPYLGLEIKSSGMLYCIAE
jgi:hypothetical protein